VNVDGGISIPCNIDDDTVVGGVVVVDRVDDSGDNVRLDLDSKTDSRDRLRCLICFDSLRRSLGGDDDDG
jgi:hypothetical protein